MEVVGLDENSKEPSIGEDCVVVGVVVGVSSLVSLISVVVVVSAIVCVVCCVVLPMSS